MSIARRLGRLLPFWKSPTESPAAKPAGTPQNSAPSFLEGYVDGIAGGAVNGWAIDKTAPNQPVMVEIYVDGVLWTYLIANEPRPDLAPVFKSSGGHGFQWELPLHLADGAPHKIVIRHSPFGTQLPGCPLVVDT